MIHYRNLRGAESRRHNRSPQDRAAQDMDESSGVKRLAGVRAVFSAPSPPRAARSASTDTQPLLDALLVVPDVFEAIDSRC